MKRLSIKMRVTLWFTLVMLVVAIAMFFLMIENRKVQVTNEAERSLVRSVMDFSMGISRRPEDADGKPENFEKPPLPEFRERTENENGGEDGGRKMYDKGVHYEIYDENKELIAGRIPFEFEDSEFKDNEVRTLYSAGEKYLVYDKMTVDSEGRTVWIKGVTNLSASLNAVNVTRSSDFFIITFIILFAAAGGYFIVWKALEPVGKMSKTAQKISQGSNLSQRIALGEGKDEIYQLAGVLDNMLEKIEKAFETEKQFTQDASHELRTPVAVIVSECEYALDCAKSSEEYKESVSVIKRQAEKMTKLIEELLLISRMDEKSAFVNFEKVNISELAEAVANEQAEINDTPLITDIDRDIYVLADDFLIARLFINLISNAFEYGANGGYVKVSLKRKDEKIIFSVEDKGMGIASEEIDRIWDRFYQINKSRTNKKGNMGLGLSMVKQIAQIHHGQVEVKSKVGEGSTFYFSMPVEF